MKLDSMSDPAIAREIGNRLHRERLNRNVSQSELAANAGISRRALQNLESGKPCTMNSLIRVLRSLDRLNALEAFLPEPALSPLQLVKFKGRERKRAGRPRAPRRP